MMISPKIGVTLYTFMSEIFNIEKRQLKANNAIMELRRYKLMHGQFFMINSESLPQGQCYIEYPDGHISLATLNSTKRDFAIIRNLSTLEVKHVRDQFGLY